MPAVRFITTTNASITADSAWRSYDCTSLIPSGMTASGVLLRYKYSAVTSNNLVGFRRGDSSDTRTWKAVAETGGTWEYAAIGLDSADNTFDYNLASGVGVPTLQVVGFFDSAHVAFLQNGAAYTPGSGSYADINIAAATGGDTAIAGIFQVDSQRTAAAVKFAWRAKGSSDDLYSYPGDEGLNGCGMVIVAVDGSEICQWKQDNAFGGASAILVGYIVSGWSFDSPASDKSTGTTGSWESVAVTTGAVAAYVEMRHTGDTHNVAGGMSTDDSVEDTYGGLAAISCALIEVTLAAAIEQKISSTSQDLYLRATVNPDAGGGGQSVDIGQVSSTESSFAVVPLRTRAVGLPTETDSALAAVPRRIHSLGLPSETDSALAATARRTHALGLADEADLAQTVTKAGAAIAIGLVTETDLALAAARLKTRATGLVSETDVAQAMARLKARAVALTTETDLAQAFAGRKTQAVALTTESDVGLAMTAALAGSIGMAAESDAAFAHTARRATAVGLVLEVDAALTATGMRTHAAGLPTETDAALAAAHAKRLAIALASESDAAQALVVVHIPVLGIALETDLALAMAALQAGGVLLGVRLLAAGASRVVHLKGSGTLH